MERVEPLTLQCYHKTETLHRNFGPLHVIYFCSHSLLLRLRKLPLPHEYLIVIGRNSVHQPKEESMDLKWWQLAKLAVASSGLMACSLRYVLSWSIFLHHGFCDRCKAVIGTIFTLVNSLWKLRGLFRNHGSLKAGLEKKWWKDTATKAKWRHRCLWVIVETQVELAKPILTRFRTWVFTKKSEKSRYYSQLHVHCFCIKTEQ